MPCAQSDHVCQQCLTQGTAYLGNDQETVADVEVLLVPDVVSYTECHKSGTKAGQERVTEFDRIGPVVQGQVGCCCRHSGSGSDSID